MTPGRVPGTPPERPNRRQEHPRSAPRGAKSDPRGARNTLGGTPERSWEPPSAPDGAQRPPEAPREASRSHFGRFLKGFWKGFQVIFDPPRASFGPLAVLFFAFCTHSKAQERNEKTRHEAQQGKAEQQSRSAPRHTPKRRACQAKRLARTSSSASVRTNTATANSGRTLSTACAATFQRIVRRCRLHLLGLPGRAFRSRANPGLTRRWATGPANF